MTIGYNPSRTAGSWPRMACASTRAHCHSSLSFAFRYGLSIHTRVGRRCCRESLAGSEACIYTRRALSIKADSSGPLNWTRCASTLTIRATRHSERRARPHSQRQRPPGRCRRPAGCWRRQLWPRFDRYTMSNLSGRSNLIFRTFAQVHLAKGGSPSRRPEELPISHSRDSDEQPAARPGRADDA